MMNRVNLSPCATYRGFSMVESDTTCEPALGQEAQLGDDELVKLARTWSVDLRDLHAETKNTPPSESDAFLGRQWVSGGCQSATGTRVRDDRHDESQQKRLGEGI